MGAAGLRETQGWFFEQLQRHAGGRASAKRHVRSQGRLDADQRLSIYSSMYFARILEALQQDFPKVREVLGDEQFEDLCRRYLRKHPSRHPSLRHVGDRFAAFLARAAEGRRVPWLVELARLERALVDAFDAPDATPIDAAALTAVPAERWGDLRFELHPSLRSLRTRFAVDRLWAQLDAKQQAQPPDRGTERLRVWRREFTVYRARMEAVEEGALRRLGAGADFAQTCEAYGEATAAARALATWLEEGLIVGLQLP
jgi:hypothetical protein